MNSRFTEKHSGGQNQNKAKLVIKNRDGEIISPVKEMIMTQTIATRPR